MNQDNKKKIEALETRLTQLSQWHTQFQKEIFELKKSIDELKAAVVTEIQGTTPVDEIKQTEPVVAITLEETGPVVVITAPEQSGPVSVPEPRKKTRTPVEEFIGTNLLNKIGIAILVIGIGFGVKYSIDHNLLNPLTRVVLGYVAGLILIGIAIRLKPKYAAFSAVLLSGGMASFYFITYAAYDFYALIPQAMAFALMVLFTAFTVFAAIQYNLQVVAVIGLVGAYSVPFLLSDGSGRVIILFSYVSIINAGILVLAFKKYWKGLYNLAFILTWLIFSAWWLDQFDYEKHLFISLGFSLIFFITFYVAFMAYKLIQNEKLSRWDVFFMLVNSFVYFSFGYFTIEAHPDGEFYQGLFTISNAVLHFIACLVIYKRQGGDKDIFYFVAGLVLVFLTLTVPVQLEGHWVTLIWAAEAALMFWIGRVKNFPVYEKLSYPLILLACGSLLQDWSAYYQVYGKLDQPIMIFLNIRFFSSVFVCVAFGFIAWLNISNKGTTRAEWLQQLLNIGMPALLLLIAYLAIFKEIEFYWMQQYYGSEVLVPASNGSDSYYTYDQDAFKMKTLWLINYSALFGLVWGIICLQFIKNRMLSLANVIFNVLVLATFLFDGLLSLSDLRTSYLNQSEAQYFFRTIMHIAIRYITLVCVIPLAWINRRLLRVEINPLIKKTEVVLLHIFILSILSSELVNGLDLAAVKNSFKLALSILWGTYALVLIVAGLKKDDKLLRIMAMILFAITLIKLFAYDLSGMSTIAKTIVMIILGALLLIASFLYNKVKKSKEDEK